MPATVSLAWLDSVVGSTSRFARRDLVSLVPLPGNQREHGDE
jgi:hypothetical protein